MATAGTVTVRLNARERALLEEYAKFVDAPISTLIRSIAVERAEDELDYKAAEKAYRQHRRHSRIFTHKEMMAKYARV